jgi:hypothetical protein
MTEGLLGERPCCCCMCGRASSASGEWVEMDWRSYSECCERVLELEGAYSFLHARESATSDGFYELPCAWNFCSQGPWIDG